MKIDPNDAAFPETNSQDVEGRSSALQGVCSTVYINSSGGLTKREHFAAVAMQGILSDSNVRLSTLEDFSNTAEISVQMADALIEALNK